MWDYKTIAMGQSWNIAFLKSLFHLNFGYRNRQTTATVL
jgi:hypothetical protein